MFDRDEFDRRPAREYQRKSVSPLINYLELDVSGRQVISRELLEKRCIQGPRLSCENHFSLVQGNHRGINVPLRIGPKIDRELAVLLVFGCIEPLVMEMVHRKLERVRWLSVRNAVGAGLRACFCAGLLACESLLQSAFTPGCLLQTQQPLVYVIADNVI